jgi:type II restriction enzyme
LIDKYEEAMQVRTEKFSQIALQTRDKILAEFQEELNHPSRQAYIDLLKSITPKTLSVTDFRVPSWSSTERLSELKAHFRTLKYAIKEIQKRTTFPLPQRLKTSKLFTSG